jgi:hypothetical protein
VVSLRSTKPRLRHCAYAPKAVAIPSLVRSAPAAPVALAAPVAMVAMLAMVAMAWLSGCKPEIGDRCTTSTDCSARGDRLCDTSQPGGYCTQLNCQRGSCADEASCVLFGSSLPGCAYDDRAGTYGSRVARSFCMARCASNEDCRAGYTCAEPREAPWSAVILDDDQSKRSCLPSPVTPASGASPGVNPPSSGAAPVCGPIAPPVSDIDASAPGPLDAGTGSGDAGKDVGADAGLVDGG